MQPMPCCRSVLPHRVTLLPDDHGQLVPDQATKEAGGPASCGTPTRPDLGSLDLEHQPTHDAKVQRIRAKMSPEAVEAVERRLKVRGVDCFSGTAWDRAGKLWLVEEGISSGSVQIQFGYQLDRLEACATSHGCSGSRGPSLPARRIDHPVEPFPWRLAWLVPGPRWRGMGILCDWCSAEHGACLRIVESGKQEPREAGTEGMGKYFDLSP